MKKNTMMRIASVLLVAVLITTCAISGTFAKYTSTANGTASASVAMWKFTLDKTGAGNNIADVANDYDEFTFDLLSTVKDTATPGTEAETDVTSGKIAPGMWGYFDIDLYNASDVNATYAINFTVTNDYAAQGLNIKFVKGANDATTLPDSGAGWNAELADVTATAINKGTSQTVRIFWQWAYETGNDDDAKNAANALETALGVLAAAGTNVKVDVTAAITVTQVD